MTVIKKIYKINVIITVKGESLMNEMHWMKNKRHYLALPLWSHIKWQLLLLPSFCNPKLKMKLKKKKHKHKHVIGKN